MKGKLFNNISPKIYFAKFQTSTIFVRRRKYNMEYFRHNRFVKIWGILLTIALQFDMLDAIFSSHSPLSVSQIETCFDQTDYDFDEDFSTICSNRLRTQSKGRNQMLSHTLTAEFPQTTVYSRPKGSKPQIPHYSLCESRFLLSLFCTYRI